MAIAASTALVELLAVLVWIVMVSSPPRASLPPAPGKARAPPPQPAPSKTSSIMDTPGDWDPELLAHEKRRRAALAAEKERAAARARRGSDTSSSSSSSSSDGSRGSGFRFRLPKIRIGHDSDSE
ncbi:hypothetical protein Q8F55_009258 [Vanrija albida]|uniref:Uncharacterized protein n=1 Tax=Vanrija albida TaxID=181172 RepID=A0ABR3PT60_9TREE